MLICIHGKILAAAALAILWSNMVLEIAENRWSRQFCLLNALRPRRIARNRQALVVDPAAGHTEPIAVHLCCLHLALECDATGAVEIGKTPRDATSYHRALLAAGRRFASG